MTKITGQDKKRNNEYVFSQEAFDVANASVIFDGPVLISDEQKPSKKFKI